MQLDLLRVVCQSFAVAGKTEIRSSGVRWQLGRISLWLRDRFILRVGIFAGAAGAASSLFVQSWSNYCSTALVGATCLIPQEAFMAWPLVLLVLGAIAGVSVVLDALADRHQKNVDKLQAVSEVKSVGKAMSSLIVLLGEIIEIGFQRGKVRKDRIGQLQTALAAAVAAAPIAENVRATYYPLTIDSSGARSLANPVSGGRLDDVTTVWEESDIPEHMIWNTLDSSDLHTEIAESPEEKFGVDWAAKPYDTFVSVPVKARDVTFGMISLNAPRVGDIGELERLTVITAARMMSAVLALEHGPEILQRENEMTVARRKLKAGGKK